MHLKWPGDFEDIALHTVAVQAYSNDVFLSCIKSYNVGDCAIKITAWVSLCEQRAGIGSGAGEDTVSMSVQGLGWGGGGGEGCIKFWI